ncbi:hypothetical protein FB45DRAFT_933344 [Roridomyces roridus]|uniref:Uncharacterized protein n=1 Tax=Roridomyces roridus TaxID=1738132 RepID=A0AAD7BC45_9AGAR|nr:hypothetical protein FB45DRAFT_933344 [Roridomyces roridus]
MARLVADLISSLRLSARPPLTSYESCSPGRRSINSALTGKMVSLCYSRCGSSTCGSTSCVSISQSSQADGELGVLQAIWWRMNGLQAVLTETYAMAGPVLRCLSSRNCVPLPFMLDTCTFGGLLSAYSRGVCFPGVGSLRSDIENNAPRFFGYSCTTSGGRTLVSGGHTCLSHGFLQARSVIKPLTAGAFGLSPRL